MAALNKSLAHEDPEVAQALLKALNSLHKVEGFSRFEIDGESVVVDFDFTKAEAREDYQSRRTNVEREVAGVLRQDDMKDAAPIFRARFTPETCEPR